MNDQELPLNVQQIDELMEKYETSVVGLPLVGKMEAPKYLSMSLEDLKKRTADELSEAYFSLNQYALYVQRLINKSKSWERWIFLKKDEIAAHYIPELPTYLGFNERELIAKNNPQICKKLNSFLRQVRLELDRLYDIPQNIRFMAEAIKDMKFLALRREKSFGDSND
jgi:hypothetical protein